LIMKKLPLLLPTLVIAAATLTTFAQGRVIFDNESTFNPIDAITVSTFNQGTSGGNPGDGIGGDKYSVQLVWAAGTNLTYSQFQAANVFGPVVTGVGAGGSTTAAFLSPTGPLSTYAGFFDAGVIPNPIGTSMPAGPYTMQVLAWYNGNGTAQTYGTWDAAYAAGKNVGVSPLFNMVVTDPPLINRTVFPGFTLLYIPEPSTLSLGILGGLAILGFRRKQRIAPT
jgi:hypothetical protein